MITIIIILRRSYLLKLFDIGTKIKELILVKVKFKKVRNYE